VHANLEIVLNGGISTLDQAQAELGAVDGVMMGRAAYQEPWRLLDVDPLILAFLRHLPHRRTLRLR
jgi:tRNA-dihydrouridine synthase A